MTFQDLYSILVAKFCRCIVPEWEETLTFNETTSYIVKPSTIFFFEVVDFVDSSHSEDDYASVGWRRIAWAFLKPFGSNDVLNVEKMLRLQLYNAIPKSSNVPSVSVPCVSIAMQIVIRCFALMSNFGYSLRNE